MITWKMAKKWFVINRVLNTAVSRKQASTLHEAWEKTLCKWILIAEHEFSKSNVHGCGLCDMYSLFDCKGCPVVDYTEQPYCYGSPYDNNNNKHELMFLLSLYEMGEI